MKKIVFFIFPVLVLAIGVVGYVWWHGAISAPRENGDERRVVINRGAGAAQIANGLKEEGVIKSAFAFRLYLQINGLTRRIPPGEFRIPSNLSVAEVAELLLDGPTEFWVSIPEGLRREQYASIFAESLEMDTAVARNFEDEFIEASRAHEGYLFPDTYLFSPEVSGSQAVEAMINNFNRRFDEEAQLGLLENTDFSLDEAVVLASIIERETKRGDERAIVAGIFLNRLQIGMPLQADATAQYALGTSADWWPGNLTRDDLSINSVFNTYVQTGLPPSPISNPGLESLLAVVNPQPTDYYYYIHDGQGQIHYGRTLEEHNENVARYLR